MTGLTAFLQYALALLFFFFLYAQAVTWVLEFISQNGNWRGRFLRGCLKNWLGRGRSINWLERVMNHPTVHGLSQSPNRSTEYIPPMAFSDAVVDILVDEAQEYRVQQDSASGEYHVQEPQGDTSMEALDIGLARIEASDFKDLLLAVRRRAGDNMDAFRYGVEAHFDAFGGRVNTWYKKRLRVPLFITGFAVAVAFNVDTLLLADALWKDPQTAAQMAEGARHVAAVYQSADDVPPEAVQAWLTQYLALVEQRPGLPFGWGAVWEHAQRGNVADNISQQTDVRASVALPVLPTPSAVGRGITPKDWVLRILGWFLSAWIASVGAPFWYEVLQKVTGYRRQPIAPAKSNASA